MVGTAFLVLNGISKTSKHFITLMAVELGETPAGKSRHGSWFSKPACLFCSKLFYFNLVTCCLLSVSVRTEEKKGADKQRCKVVILRSIQETSRDKENCSFSVSWVRALLQVDLCWVFPCAFWQPVKALSPSVKLQCLCLPPYLHLWPHPLFFLGHLLTDFQHGQRTASPPPFPPSFMEGNNPLYTTMQ